MEEKTYNILWFDDKCNETSHRYILKSAQRSNIKLFGFESAQQGIPELKNHYLKYDGILLDGLFYQKVDSDGDNVDEGALQEVLYALESIAVKFMPFVLSGMTSFTQDENPVIKFHPKINKVYDKSSTENLDQLWYDIKQSADKREETQIKHEFHDVFELCTEQYLGEKSFEPLLKLLLFLKGKDRFDEDKFNAIRKLLEAVLYACDRYGMIHDKCKIAGSINLTWSLKYLQGEEVPIPNEREWKWKISGPKCMPDLIAEFAMSIKEITSIGSHYEDDESISDDERTRNKAKISQLQQYVTKPYLVKSLIFQLIDVLLWFKSYVDEHPKAEENRSRWNPIIYPGWIEGTITEINDKGWATFVPKHSGKKINIHPTVISRNGLEQGNALKLIAEYSMEEKVKIKNVQKL